MQTFLPLPDFQQSLRCLDRQRLGKQRVEAFQIINTILLKQENTEEYFAWQNHPAVLMWEENVLALQHYYNLCLNEWNRRGYKNIKLGRFQLSTVQITMPTWLGDERLHSSHRSNLLRKDYVYYSQFGWTEPADLEYWWPVTIETRRT